MKSDILGNSDIHPGVACYNVIKVREQEECMV